MTPPTERGPRIAGLKGALRMGPQDFPSLLLLYPQETHSWSLFWKDSSCSLHPSSADFKWGTCNGGGPPGHRQGAHMGRAGVELELELPSDLAAKCWRGCLLTSHWELRTLMCQRATSSPALPWPCGSRVGVPSYQVQHCFLFFPGDPSLCQRPFPGRCPFAAQSGGPRCIPAAPPWLHSHPHPP